MIPEALEIDVMFFNNLSAKWEKYETLKLVDQESVKKVPLGPLGIVFPFKGKDWECTIDVSGKNIKITGDLYLDLKNIPYFIKKMGESDYGFNTK